MMADGADAFGNHVAVARRAHGMTQLQLADAAAISVSLLRKIEQGIRIATPSVRASIMRALDLDDVTSANLDRNVSGRIHDAIPAIRRAIDCFDLPEDGPIRPLTELQADVADATTWRLESRYAQLAELIPGLLTELTRAVHSLAGHDRETAFGLLAMAHRAADAIADKHGYIDLSARAIELIRWSAANSGDPLLGGMAGYVRAELFFAGPHAQAGLRALDTATRSVDPGPTRAAMAVYGSLQMRGGVLAARAGLRDEARARLAEARDATRRIPDGVYYGTAFGPSSIRVHEVAAAAELGDAAGVLAYADGWQPPSALPAERRSHFFIEIARAQLWASRRTSALSSLQRAREIAPQHTRCNPVVRDTVSALLRLHRKPSDALLRFATWVGTCS